MCLWWHNMILLLQGLSEHSSCLSEHCSCLPEHCFGLPQRCLGLPQGRLGLPLDVRQVFRRVREAATGSFKEPTHEESYCAGLDLAKVEDYTALVVVNHKKEIVALDRFNRVDWEIQVARIRATLDKYRRCRVLVDSTGVGEPIYEALRVGGCYAEPYPLTHKSKADIINHLALMLEKEQIVLPRVEIDPVLVEELEAYEYSVSDAGNVKMSSPSGLHDDTVIALSLAMWEAKNLRRPSPPRPLVRRKKSRMEIAREMLGAPKEKFSMQD